jgi:hypothetical protein
MIVGGFKIGARDGKPAATPVACECRTNALPERGSSVSALRKRGLGGQQALYSGDEVTAITS